VTAIDHGARAHARLAPSASWRWWNCPGSIRMSAGIARTSSVYADEGTAAHELAQYCFEKGFDADRFAGEFVNLDAADGRRIDKSEIGDRSFPIDDETVEGVQVYLDLVREIAARPRNGFAGGIEYDCEQFVDLTYLGVAGLDGGTADFAAYDPNEKSLELVDFKYGRGVPVDPQRNTQLLCYALGAIRRYSNRGLAKLRLTVVQPRCPHPGGPVRTWEADVLDLLDFEAELKTRALATFDPEAPLKAGEWCKFCPAGAVCPERRNHALALAQAEFSAVGDMTLPVVAELSGERLSALLGHVGEIEDFCRRVKDHAHLEAAHGRTPPGWKLVAKRATRKWTDESTVEWALAEAFGIEDIYQPRKLKSPAQIEPMMPGKNKAARAAALADYVSKESSGTVLALESDPRPAAQADASEFGEVA